MNQNSYYSMYPYDRSNQLPSNNFYPQTTEGTYPQAIDGNYSQDERFFLAPFVVGGLAGTALGYGIANNNQMNKGGCCMQPIYYYPISQPMPTPYTFSNSNNNFFY